MKESQHNRCGWRGKALPEICMPGSWCTAKYIMTSIGRTNTIAAQNRHVFAAE
jgi:hypothetical protein